MQASLTDEQWNAVESGQVISPAGRRFTRRSSRIKRRDADPLIAGGAPLVLYWFGGRQLDYFDGTEAVEQWKVVRQALTSQTPQLRGDVVWTGGLWVGDDDEDLLLLTGQC
ncbi:hypothetical protein [Kineococcus rubinsiae]|uniref:hypothetical protein n=1 Tax=Kineococcus rubinsiae TaxID=2609562 RepID=UPI0014307F09|nr:hypothetical protein [Kineococcus rubinsiae]NIZ90307.1 hypothetical protein [Kineococcus rubinsiae]